VTNLPNPARKKSIAQLLGELPGLLTTLVKDGATWKADTLWFK
jgi:hypothetical protein